MDKDEDEFYVDVKEVLLNEFFVEEYAFKARPAVPDSEVAKVIVLNGPRSILESVHNGGMIPRGKPYSVSIYVAAILALSTLRSSKEEFLTYLGPFLRPRSYWKEPILDENIAVRIPKPVDQVVSLPDLFLFSKSVLKGAYEVPELVKHRLPRRKTCFHGISDPDMMAINIAMTNYVFARLLFFRGGIHDVDILEG